MGRVPEISSWDQFEHDPRLPAHAGLRSSERDRGVVASVLADAFAEGRLDRTEYDERLERALACRTLGDLVPLVQDLPLGTSTVPVAPVRRDHLAAAQRSYLSDQREAVWTFVTVTLVCWLIWTMGSWGPDGLDPGFPWPLFPMLFTALRAARMRWQREEYVADEVRRLEKKERKAIEKAQRERDENAPE